MDRTSFVNALKNVAMKVTLEESDKFYKRYSPIYPKLVTVKSIDEIKGAYEQMTSVIGSYQFQERNEGEQIEFEDDVEGFPVYIKKRSFDLGKEVTAELDRDFEQAKSYMRNFVKAKMLPAAAARTKEIAVANLFNYGGFTAGHATFDNSLPGIISPSYGSLCYDAKPFLTQSGNNRTAKNGSTYYNHIGALTLTFDNLVTADTLLTATNAKTENGSPFDNLQGNKLLCTPSNRLAADRLINSTLRPENANNDRNPLKSEYEVVVNPYITTAAAWAVGNKDGIYFYDSGDVVFDIWFEHTIRKWKIAAHLDLAYAVINWRAWVAANFPSA